MGMQHDPSPSLFSADQRHLWRASAPSLWSLAHENPDESPQKSIMRTLWDQPRWLEAYHLYDERGSELFEQICELPEYYLTRTEEAILERDAANIIASAPVDCIVELGAGSAKKTNHLLKAQIRQHGSGIFAPVDVSVPGLVASRNFVRQNFPQIDFQGLHARYEDALANMDGKHRTLFVFLGSTVGNFNPPAFVRFFSLLSHAMGPNDFLLLGADRVKDVGVLEAAYDDSQGLTAEFILNIFKNINRTVTSNFDAGKMRYHSRYNTEWQQVEMYAVSTATQQIDFPSFRTSFRWKKDDRILVEISRKFDPERLQDQFRFFDLLPVKHFTDPKEWFSLLLFRKAS
jgi:L-histidine Nalpha-methyltransferase